MQLGNSVVNFLKYPLTKYSRNMSHFLPFQLFFLTPSIFTFIIILFGGTNLIFVNCLNGYNSFSLTSSFPHILTINNEKHCLSKRKN